MQTSQHKPTAESNRHRLTQRERVLELLQSRCGEWVGLPEILDLNIAQYGVRILELRRAGFCIENRQEGEHSRFRLLSGKSSATNDLSDPASTPKQPQSAQGELFTPGHRDLG